MTIDLDSKPNRTRRAKSLEEQVAEADAIPYLPHIVAQGDVTEEEIPLTYDKPGYDGNETWVVGDQPLSPEEAAEFQAMADANAEMIRRSDTGEIEMTPEQQAEFEARARLGFGGPNGSEPGTILVTGYDANGEAVDVEVERSARSAEADAVTTKPPPTDWSAAKSDVSTIGQLLMPGFPSWQAVHEVAVNISGRILLNVANRTERETWESLALGARVTLELDGVVVDRGGHLSLDSDLEDKKRLAKASVKVVGLHVLETEEDDDDDGRETLLDTIIADLAAGAHELLGQPDIELPAALEFLEQVAAHGSPRALRCDSCGERGANHRAGMPDYCDACFAANAADEDGPLEVADENPVATALDEALAIAGDDDDGDA